MKSKFWTITAAICLLTTGGADAWATPPSFGAPQSFPVSRTVTSSRHDLSRPLRDIRLSLSPFMQQVIGNRNPSKARMRELRQKLIVSGLLKPPATQRPASSASPTRKRPRVGTRDTVLQAHVGQAAAGGFNQPIHSFEGIGIEDYRNLHSYLTLQPPYDNIAVGLHDVMEVTNYALAAYSKQDGSPVFGPMILRKLWSGFPTGSNHCGYLNVTSVPAAVMYDQWAQRWVVSFPSGTTYCLAVSATSDPAGRWYRYAFQGLGPRFSTIVSNKMGIWPNSYLVAFSFNGYPRSVGFMAIDRDVVLQGGRTGTLLVWNVPESDGAYADLPVSVEGYRQPPAGSPALFANYVSPDVPDVYGTHFPYALSLWEISNLDWSAPAKAQLSLAHIISLPPFNDDLCNNSESCIPERAPGAKLASVSDRLMPPLVYRNLGDHEALVANHTVTAHQDGTPPAGIRWYEFDTSNPGANDWTLKQSGTYEPADGNSRWIGSIGMDASGDMALGYSLSGPAINPSIAYTGRKAGAPAGKMTEPETTLIKSGGVLLSTVDYKWGPFSSMRMDPADGCSFWYVNQYLAVSGFEQWHTRIGAFRFPSCQTAVRLGSLHGTVTDASTAQTVSGAEITLAPNFITDYTDTNGHYQYSLPPGQYMANVFDFGYKPADAQVTVTGDGNVEQDFALVPAPTATLSGEVTDKAHGYGLYAEITIVAKDVGQVADVWTDPATGQYSVALPKDFDYTISVNPYWDGYQAAPPAETTLKGDDAEDFSLQVGATCSAPGYAVSSGFGEDFNGGFPPKGWTVANLVQGSPVVWKSNIAWGDPNWTGGTGQSADVNSGAATTGTGYKGPFADDLITPPIAVTAISANPILEFKANFAKFGVGVPDIDDQLRVYIKSDKDASWNQVKVYTNSLGTPFALPGATERINLEPYITAGASTFQLLWRYRMTSYGTDVWYAQVDDVVIGACKPVIGGVVSGQVTDTNTGAALNNASVIEDRGTTVKTIVNLRDARLKPGTYVTFLSDGRHRLTATAPKYSPDTAEINVKKGASVEQNLQLGAGKFSADKGSITIDVPVGGTRNIALTVDNAGTVAAHYRLVTLNVPVFGTQQPPAATEVPSASTAAPGSVVSAFPSGLKYLGGLSVGRGRGDLWLGNPHPANVNPYAVVTPGENHDIRYRMDGTQTSDRINVRVPGALTMYDMAYDDVTGMLWQVGADYTVRFNESTQVDTSHIYELDPKTLLPTGRKITVPAGMPGLGLAFDPVSATFYAAVPDTDGIYHFNGSGKLLDAASVGINIDALAYNPGTGHLFALAQSSTIYVFDAKHGYALVTSFAVPGVGVGLDYDCAGHLWLTDAAGKKVFEVVSGETGWCSIEHIPWLTVAPAAGTLSAGGSAAVALHFSGAGQKPYTSSQAQLRVAGRTPYPVQTIPVTVNWEAQPAALTLSGSAAPTSVNKGNNVVYTLTVKNGREAGHGPATEMQLTYPLPAGASYVSSSGDSGVVCTAPSAGTAPETVTCQLGTLSPGTSRAMTLAIQADTAGTLTSEFTVSAREPNDGKSTLKLSTPVIGDADIGVSAEDTTLTQGSSGNVRLAVSNGGPDTASAVVLTISASNASNVKLQGVASDQGICAPQPKNTYECELGDIAAGGKVGVTLTVFGISVGQATIKAYAKTGANDFDTDNDTATARVTVNAPNPTPSANKGGSGGGGFGWLGLVALLGLASAGLIVRRRATLSARPSSDQFSGDAMSKRRNKYLSLLGGLVLASVIGAGLAPGASLAQQSHGQKPRVAKTGLRAGLTPSSVGLARDQLAPPKFVTMPLQTAPSLLARASRVGTHDPDANIHLSFGLKLHHVSQLKQFLQALNNPASPEYRQFLTPAEFTAEYGPTKSDVAAVEKYLKRRDITVTDVSPNRLLIHTAGTTLAYENALGVQINNYRLNGRSFFSTEDRPKLPRAVSGVVQSVIGLNNAAQFRPHSHVDPLPASKGSRAAGRATAQALAPPPATSGYYNPHQIAKAYDWPSITRRDEGEGVNIAIVTTESNSLENLGIVRNYQTFWSVYGLPDHTVNVINVGTSFNDLGLTETMLDIEWSGAMAPGAVLNVYAGGDASGSTFMELYNRAVTDANPDGTPKNQVMTTSWGFIESGASEQFAETADAIFMQGASEGISMFAASGDYGASDGTPFPNVADFPSSDPHVTAANGTVLNADAEGDYISESAWSDTGGAISKFFSEPAWQTGPGVPQNSWRNNSDLAMNAGGARPYLFRYGNGWVTGGGTSFVAPQLAALFAIGVWQHGGKMLGQSNELIYAVVNADPENYASDFHDVASGCNGQLLDLSPSCAKANWDHPTGWGSPRAAALLDDLGVQGPVGALQGTVTDAASGKALANAKVVVTPNNLSRITRSDGSYKILLAPGTYTVTVSDFGYKVASSSVTIVDGETTTQDFSLVAVPMATVSGKVKDASGHGYGLYAEIKVTSPDFDGAGPVADVWSNPTDGFYHLNLPEGYDYKIEVAATFNGYNPGSWEISELSADQHHDFGLTISEACTAPGYNFVQGFGEDFNDFYANPGAPTGWSYSATPVAAAWGSTGCKLCRAGNWTGGSGNAMYAQAGGFVWPPVTSFDSQLITPSIPTADVPPGANLTFLVNYQHLNNDALDVGISGDGGKTWTRMAHLVKSYGAFQSTPGVRYKVADIGSYIPAGAGSIKIRWHYYNKVAYQAHYVEIDDVAIGACETVLGGLVMGQVNDANTGNGIVGAQVTGDQGASLKTIVNSADSALPVGFYMLFAPDGTRRLTVTDYNHSPTSAAVEMSANAVVTQNFALDAGNLTATPAGINVQATIGKLTTKTLTIANIGSAIANFSLHKINLPTSPDGSSAPAVQLTDPMPTTSEMARRKASVSAAVPAAPGPRIGRLASVPLASPAAQTAGAVIATFQPGFMPNGIGVDRYAGDLWLGSQFNNGGSPRPHGDDRDHRFLFDGTDTGGEINVAFPDEVGLEDMAFDINTGKLWQIIYFGDGHECIYELDPVTEQPTGKEICPNVPPVSGLAYDPVSNTWILGGNSLAAGSYAIYQINAMGKILGYKELFVPVVALAYNPGTGHLFVVGCGSSDICVFDAGHNFLGKPTQIDIPGFNASSDGLGFDCGGHLWAGQYVDPRILEVASGEEGWCSLRHIPWLTLEPATGRLNAGDQAAVTLSFDGKGQKPFTTSQVQLKLQGTTPYGTQTIPVTVQWEPKPADLALTGSSAPATLNKGDSLVYTLKAANGQETGHGPATQTMLTAKLAAGVSYVSSGGDDVTCAAPAEDFTIAPTAATSPTTVVTCSLGKLALGAAKTVTIAVTANAAGTQVSRFTVSTREPNDSGKNTLKLSTTVIGDADLSASAEDATIPVSGSGTLHFAVANAGPDPATDVAFKVAVGPSARLQSVTSSQGRCEISGVVLNCELGEVAAGAAVEIDIQAFGTYAGMAAVTGKTTTSSNDADQDNNVATASVTVKAVSGGESNSNSSGGGGSFGWLVLAALFGLALTGALISMSRRQS